METPQQQPSCLFVVLYLTTKPKKHCCSTVHLDIALPATTFMLICSSVVDYKTEKKTFTPEEISSMVLTKMRETASQFSGEDGLLSLYLHASMTHSAKQQDMLHLWLVLTSCNSSMSQQQRLLPTDLAGHLSQSAMCSSLTLAVVPVMLVC